MPSRSEIQYSTSDELLREESSAPESDGDELELDLNIDDLMLGDEAAGDAEVIARLTRDEPSPEQPAAVTNPVKLESAPDREPEPAPPVEAAPEPSSPAPAGETAAEELIRLYGHLTLDQLCGPGDPEAEQPAPKPVSDRPEFNSIIALRRAKAERKAATARYDAERDAASKARNREQSAARSKRYRASTRTVIEKTAEQILKELESAPFPDPIPWRRHRPYKKRLQALCEATANPKADSFLVQMRGRELEITDAWVIVLDARKKYGANASLAQIAWHHPDKSMTKHRVRRMLENIAKLEQPGQAWAA
jgi:hypothetical protein